MGRNSGCASASSGGRVGTGHDRAAGEVCPDVLVPAGPTAQAVARTTLGNVVGDYSDGQPGRARRGRQRMAWRSLLTRNKQW